MNDVYDGGFESGEVCARVSRMKRLFAIVSLSKTTNIINQNMGSYYK